MAFGSRVSQVTLVLGFLAIIFGVPTWQIVVELRQQQPVQATDLFRYAPTVKNLRGFEQALEDNWWGQDLIRPRMQQGLFLSFRDTGSKALEGCDGWLFYRAGSRVFDRRGLPGSRAQRFGVGRDADRANTTGQRGASDRSVSRSTETTGNRTACRTRAE